MRGRSTRMESGVCRVSARSRCHHLARCRHRRHGAPRRRGTDSCRGRLQCADHHAEYRQEDPRMSDSRKPINDLADIPYEELEDTVDTTMDAALPLDRLHEEGIDVPAHWLGSI